jgi:hypothetical protein
VPGQRGMALAGATEPVEYVEPVIEALCHRSGGPSSRAVP